MRLDNSVNSRFLYSGLKEITIPSGVKSIGDYAFCECTFLEKVYIGSSVTNIGKRAFEGADKLTAYVEAGSYAEQYAIENGIKFEVNNK